MQLIGGQQPFFDPYGWTPELGFDKALDVMGWTSTISEGNDARDALARLKTALAEVLYGSARWTWENCAINPGKTGPVGADHYVVVLGMQDDSVILHDPEGYPYSTLAAGALHCCVAGRIARLWLAFHDAKRIPSGKTGHRAGYCARDDPDCDGMALHARRFRHCRRPAAAMPRPPNNWPT